MLFIVRTSASQPELSSSRGLGPARALVSTSSGAGQIWGLSAELAQEPIFNDMVIFAALHDEWEEAPAERTAIEDQIVAEATAFVNKWRTRITDELLS
jgi:hypothetical protein